MAITLITGTPGAGKTALAVAMLMEEKQRPIYADGITDFSLLHEPLPPIDQWTTFVADPSSSTGQKLVFDFPDGALVVVDECQRHFRPRAVGAKVPDAVAAFETHRHQGLDFFLITQHPGLLDANVRRLVGRHIHIRHTWMGRKLHEWPSIGDPETKSSLDISAKRNFKPPKEAFTRYTSATVHTTTKKRVPLVAYALGLAVVAFGVLGWRVYVRMHEVTQGQVATVTEKGVKGVIGATADGLPKVDLNSDTAWSPAVFGRPESAPAYSEMRKVVAMPWPAACMKMGSECRCYTDQATALRDISPERCLEILRFGVFNPYEKRQESRQTVVEKAVAQDAAKTGLIADSARPGGVIPDHGGVGVDGWKKGASGVTSIASGAGKPG